MAEITAQTRAERCAAAMYATDSASKGLGMQIDHIAPGAATLSMTLREDMLNGHRIAHGGFLFTLADSAFAFACNSYNQLTVAQQNQITFMAPGREGERVTATAVEVSRTGRSGIYDVTVTGEDGRILALMRGLSRTIKGTHFDEENGMDGEETDQ
jgi:acyl-CoA thioesterase